METQRYRSFLLLLLFLVFLLSLNPSQISFARTPYLSLLKFLDDPNKGQNSTFIELEENLNLLANENLRLKNSLAACYEIIEQAHTTEVKQALNTTLAFEDCLFKEDSIKALEAVSCSIPAKVYARPYSHWASFIWVDIGERANRQVHKKVIGKNSPVVFGDHLVGVVEEVYPHTAKVRLITDANLFPSVRVARGDPQVLLLKEAIGKLLELSLVVETGLDNEELQRWHVLSEKVNDRLKLKGSRLLAKGFIHGKGGALWHSRTQTFLGTGFNYDFSDKVGPALDLGTGLPYEEGGARKNGLTMIQEGDVLMTTGMDGIFPAGLKAGLVTKVLPLEEGAYFYQLEAKPLYNPDALSSVFILPPPEDLNPQ